MRNINQRGQQEMVGFVLIVVLVIIGLMIFLVISLRDSDSEKDSLEASYMLNAIMKYTTDCAIVYEPDFDTFEDLFKSCYKNKRCNNLGISACEYLNESLRDVLVDLMKGEANVIGYQLDFFVKKDDDISQGLLKVNEGDCTGASLAAQRTIISGSDSLVVRMKICKVV